MVAVRPCGGLVVVGAGPEAAVEVADKAVAEGARRLRVEVAALPDPPHPYPLLPQSGWVGEPGAGLGPPRTLGYPAGRAEGIKDPSPNSGSAVESKHSLPG